MVFLAAEVAKAIEYSALALVSRRMRTLSGSQLQSDGSMVEAAAVFPPLLTTTLGLMVVMTSL